MKRPPTTEDKAISITTWHDADDLRWAVRHWSTRIGVKLTRGQIRALRTKWASISTNGSMTLATDLLTLPKELGEFVILPHLVHLLVPNPAKSSNTILLPY